MNTLANYTTYYAVLVLTLIFSINASGQQNEFKPIVVNREDGFYATLNYTKNMGSTDIELEKKATLKLHHIKSAKKSISSYSNQPEIVIKLTKEGQEIFSLLTKTNLGKPIAIVLDKKIVYLPIVQSEITGGIVAISGNFSVEETQRMVARLQQK